MNKGICTFVLHSLHWFNESHASGTKSSLSFPKGFDFQALIPITMLLLTRQWNIQDNIGHNYIYWKERTNVDPGIVLAFFLKEIFLKEKKKKKLKEKNLLASNEKWNISVLWFFHFIQTRLGRTQQGGARDILQFPGLVLQQHIKLLETSIRRQKIDFSAFEVRTKGIVLSFLLPVFFPPNLLPTVLFLPSFPYRFHNPHVPSAYCCSLFSFQDSILRSLYDWPFIHSFNQWLIEHISICCMGCSYYINSHIIGIILWNKSTTVLQCCRHIADITIKLFLMMGSLPKMAIMKAGT